jgi:hypothetical protein
MLTADIAFATVLIAMIACSVYFAPRIKSDRIAMQWSFAGKPTWYAPKLAGLWGPLAFAVLVRLVIWGAQTWMPDKVHGAEIGLTLASAVIVVVHFVTLKIAAR